MRCLLTFLLLFSTTFSMAADRTSIGLQAIVIAADVNADSLKLTPQKLKLIYLRKQLYWPNGKRIQAVNLHTENPQRKQFSQAVLGNLPNEQVRYWNEQYFNGVLPPYSVNSEEAVLRYVAQTNGAIGYVNACSVDNRVQALFWIINDQVTASAPDNLNCQ